MSKKLTFTLFRFHTFTLSHFRTSKGFTLVEVLIVVAVIAVIIVAVSPLIKTSLTSWQLGQRRSEVLQNARIGMDKIVHELKQAKSFISVTDSTDINGRIVFEDRSDNTVEFKRYNDGSDNTLGYVSGGDTTSLAGPIESLQFTCYEKGGTTTTNPYKIQSIMIEMVTSDNEGQVGSHTLSARVHCPKNIFSIVINEIMYNPTSEQGGDSTAEWIELFNFTEGNIDVGGWKLSTGGAADTLSGDSVHGDGSTSIPTQGYAIITDTDTTIYDVTELVQNGGFETGSLAGWTYHPSTGGDRWRKTNAHSHSGSNSARCSVNGYIYQEIAVPASGTSLNFSSWERTDGSATLKITIRNTSDVILETVYDGAMQGSWTEHTATLTGYENQTIRIHFELTGPTDYCYLDDVSIPGGSLFSVPAEAVKITTGDGNIGNGLSNPGDTITLSDGSANDYTVDSVTYSNSWGGDNNGRSLERIDPLGPSSDSSNWEESAVNGSPGSAN